MVIPLWLVRIHARGVQRCHSKRSHLRALAKRERCLIPRVANTEARRVAVKFQMNAAAYQIDQSGFLTCKENLLYM